MPTHLDRSRARQCLEAFDLKTLFIDELGWDRGGASTEARVRGHIFPLEAIAQKRGLVAYQYLADSDGAFPDYPTRRKIEQTGLQDRPRTHHRLRYPLRQYAPLAMGETRAGPTRQPAPAHLPSGPTGRGADPETGADRLHAGGGRRPDHRRCFGPGASRL